MTSVDHGSHLQNPRRSLPTLARILTSQDSESLADEYVRYVRSCYRHHPEAFSYYEQLVNYVTKSGSSQLQRPRLYQPLLRQLQSESDNETCFMFEEVTGDNGWPTDSTVFLEGFPSPECVVSLGLRLLLRPELFLDHLDFAKKHYPRYCYNHYEIPIPPSRRENIVHVTVVTLGRSVDDMSVKVQTDRRNEMDENCCRIQKELFAEKRYGATRFRKINLHDSRTFSVEQTISFSVGWDDGGNWHGVFLLDKGITYEETRYKLPWTKCDADGRPMGSISLLPYNATNPLKTGSSTHAVSSLDHLHPLKNLQIQDEIDLELLRSDPFFLLSATLSTACMLWSTLLNFVEAGVKTCRAAAPTALDAALEQLRFNSDVISRVEDFILENASLIEGGGCKTWPKALDEEQLHRKRAIQQTLEADYAFLKLRCARLAKECEIVSSMLVSSAQLLQAQKGINQARQVHVLTKLAFFFIPVGFVSSLFGMNVTELKRDVSIWVFFVIAVPLSAVCYLVADWTAFFGRVRERIR